MLGVTPWLADCDFVSHHFDDGIPFEEAFSHSSMPATLVKDVGFRKSHTTGKPVLLSISALDLSRKQKAAYYRDAPETPDEVKARWTELPFDHPDIIMAYTNYIRWLAGQFQPAWINYGVESNLALIPEISSCQYLE
ncbi:hypothetical protein BC349_13870 [Flavihumibacter stibioxidans]|uniref:Sulfatase N-terminal domain-containing protein n=2 Tax=Flavihumibacter stibioxidans TaxID=1834163 RepID=A0ABR7MCB5_9BACT|nr:hypothetical protein [Flavihumibacter stibioxidans]